MKKTISIHLMGTNFLIEEDGYELVRDYLDRLKNSLRNSPDSKEIFEDVELRIAELATALISEKKQVVTYDEMREILNTLGQPEEFLEDEMQDAPNTGSNSESTFKNERRLFRDTENGMIAGVCAGLAAYFKVDVVVFRIIFVILGFAGGFIVPLYLIMWIVVPRAKTNLERLQMQGRPINLETLKEEFDDATQRFTKTSRKFEKEFSDRNSPTRRRINAGASIIAKLIGVGLLIFGSIGLIVLIFFSFVEIRLPFSDSQLNYKQFSDLILLNDSNSFYLWLGGFLAGLAMVLFAILLGSVLLFKLRSKWIKRSFLLLTLLGVSGLVTGIYQGVRLGSDFAIAGEFEQKVGESADTVLYVNILESLHPNHVKGRNYRFDGDIFEISNGKVIEGGIDVNYSLSEDSNFHVYVEYSALGNGKKIAAIRSKNIIHEVAMTGNQLTIAPYFRFPKVDKIRNQSVSLTIQIPQGKKVEYKNFKVHSDDVKDQGYIDDNGEYEHYSDDEDEWLHFDF